MKRVSLRDGEQLALREIGRGAPLLLVHGFTGSAAAWGPAVLDALGARHRVLAVDLLGHGASSKPKRAARYAIEQAVADLCEVLDSCGIERASWLGYSMGGRIALGAACLRPARVSGLTLESASPGLAESGERAERIASDEVLACMLETRGMGPFVEHWMRIPLFRTQATLPTARRDEERRRRLANDPAALAACLRGLGTGVQPSLWETLPGLHAPVGLIVGEQDTKFRAIAARMQHALPLADSRIVHGAGHATHLERPVEFLRAVEELQKGELEDERRVESGR